MIGKERPAADGESELAVIASPPGADGAAGLVERTEQATNEAETTNETTPVIWIVVPVYNNQRTVREAVVGSLKTGLKVVVVDDGCSDGSVAELDGLDVEILVHDVNCGKGRALLTAAQHIHAAGGTHMICFDADGQFEPNDINAFIETILHSPESLLYGIREFGPDAPGSSVFGRKFSNFWSRVTTGKKVLDSQCGFRAYPLGVLLGLGIKSSRYDFEVDALVRSSWAGVPLVGVPIEVTYSPPGGRVTHFHPFLDNARISRSYTRLCARAILPIPHKIVYRAPGERTKKVLSPWRPVAFFKALLTEKSSPWELAAAVTLGLFVATLPIFGLHSVAIIYAATKLKLNRLLAFSVSNLCAPPIVPAFCLEVGYFMRHGEWLSTFNAETLWSQLNDRFLEYVIGAIAVAPVLAAIGGAFTFVLVSAIGATTGKDGNESSHQTRRGLTAAHGSSLGMGFYNMALKLIGLRGAYLLLWVPVPFYLLFRPSVRAGLRPYLVHRFPQAGAFRLLVEGFKLLMEFSRTMVDQAAALIFGRDFFSADAAEGKQLVELLDNDRGTVLLMSHAGNWKTTVPILEVTDTKVNLLIHIDTTVAASVPGAESGLFGSAKVIDPLGPFGGLIEATAALSNHEIVSIMGDRVWGGSTVDVEFLGDRAHLPESPYRLALSTGSQVIVAFVGRAGYRKFQVEFHELPDDILGAPTKTEAATRMAQAYTDCLEDFVSRNPYSWSNFFDFWRAPDSTGGVS